MTSLPYIQYVMTPYWSLRDAVLLFICRYKRFYSDTGRMLSLFRKTWKTRSLAQRWGRRATEPAKTIATELAMAAVTYLSSGAG